MESTGILHQESTAAYGGVNADIPKGEKKPITIPLVTSRLRRKRLSDISNLASEGMAVARSFAKGGQENAVAGAPTTSTKDAYIAQLLKENNALMRALGERNKVIELGAAEIQNLRFTLQKLTQQNHQLAQNNSQLLAEHNQDKDRLKAFQHEMVCQKAALKVTSLELEENNKLIRQLRGMIGIEQFIAGQPKFNEVAGDAPIPASHKAACNTTRKRAPRNRSFSLTSATNHVAVKEKCESSRKSSRRSVGFKHEQCEHSEDLFEIEDVKFRILSLASDPMSDDSSDQADSLASVSNTLAYPVKVEEEQWDLRGTPQIDNHGQRRSSMGRPMRRAAEKVNSYKETPINIKMRRPE